MEYHKSSTATLSKKLTNGRSFNGKSIYDGVFSGPRKSGSHFEDYGEIFGRSGSTIPILDVPELNEKKISVDVSSSKLDYSNIFGGFGGSDFAVSYEELLAKPKKGGDSSTEEANWTPAETRSKGSCPTRLSVENQDFSDKASYQSFDAVNQFKMSYHKTNQGSENGTTHIAQIHAVPSYSHLIDEIPLRMTEGDKPVPSALNDVYLNINSSRGIMEGGKHCRKTMPDLRPGVASKQTSAVGVEIKSKSNWNRSNSNDMLFGEYKFGLRTHPMKVPPPSSLPHNLGNNKGDSNKSMSSKFGVSKNHPCEGASGSPPYFDEELDTDSVAAASAAAVIKAIEEAQARIKFAKELMVRKKGGLQSRAKPGFSDGLKADKREGGKSTYEANKFREEAAQEICEEVDAPMQAFSEITKQNATKACQENSDFRDKETPIIAKEATREAHGKNFKTTPVEHSQEEVEEWAAAKQGDGVKKMMQFLNEYDREGNSMAKETFEKPEEYGMKFETDEAAHKQEVERNLNAVKETCELKECANKLKSAQTVLDQEENEKKLRVAQQQEETDEKLEASYELDACEKKLKEIQKPKENERKHETPELKDNENTSKLKEAQEWVENEMRQKEAHKQEENDTRSKDDPETKEKEMMLKVFFGKKENEKRNEEACEKVEFEKEITEAYRLVENEGELKEIFSEDTETRSDKVQEPENEIIEVRPNDFHETEEIDKRVEEDGESKGNEKVIEAEEDGRSLLEEACQMKETEERQKETSEWVETESIQTEIYWEAEDENMEVTQEAFKYCRINLETSIDACMQDEIENHSWTIEACRHEENNEGEEVTPVVLAHRENEGIMEVTEDSFEFKENEKESKAVEVENDLDEKEMFETADLAQGAFEPNEIKKQVKDTGEGINLGIAGVFEPNEIKKHVKDTSEGINLGIADMSFVRQKQHDEHAEESKIVCNTRQRVEELACESEETYKDVNEAEVAIKQEVEENNIGSSHEERWVDNEKSMEAAQLPNSFEGEGETADIAYEIKTSRSAEKDEENQYETLAMEEREARDTLQKEVELGKEHLGKIDEAKERERERDKERIAVERAIREARERAFAEARERATVEKANAEARRRERLEKSSADGAPQSSAQKASMEAKLKVERAAVERATAEARERALEKALSDKAAMEARNQAEKFSGASRDNGMRQSFSSYDPQYRGSGPSSSFRSPNSSNHGVPYSNERFDGANGESAERCKATFERHQRTTERAAKALAEKNMRDLLAQKEQAERNRLAEVLDADFKRWSSGKEGNLRALLSTLQYILGTDSGWQPIHLTDIITTTAVKKAYRKATLCVHPDKLQQRGASVPQKYTCEKVFDLLQEAWNKFSKEER